MHLKRNYKRDKEKKIKSRHDILYKRVISRWKILQKSNIVPWYHFWKIILNQNSSCRYLHMFMDIWQMETPRNVSSNAHTATSVVDMAQENGESVPDGRTTAAFRGNKVDKPEDTVDNDNHACARHSPLWILHPRPSNCTPCSPLNAFWLCSATMSHLDVTGPFHLGHRFIAQLVDVCSRITNLSRWLQLAKIDFANQVGGRCWKRTEICDIGFEFLTRG